MLDKSNLGKYKASLRDRWTPVVALVPSEQAEDYFTSHTTSTILKAFASENVVHGLNKGLGGGLQVVQRFVLLFEFVICWL